MVPVSLNMSALMADGLMWAIVLHLDKSDISGQWATIKMWHMGKSVTCNNFKIIQIKYESYRYFSSNIIQKIFIFPISVVDNQISSLCPPSELVIIIRGLLESGVGSLCLWWDLTSGDIIALTTIQTTGSNWSGKRKKQLDEFIFFSCVEQIYLFTTVCVREFIKFGATFKTLKIFK